MKSKREYIRDAWQVYCKVYHIPHDEVDVYTAGGHWYGQCRKIVGTGNTQSTQLLSEWLIRFKIVDQDTADFQAHKIRDYEFPKH